MRRLPPSREPEEKTAWTIMAPKAIGLVIGLALGYLLLPGAASEPPAAAPSASASAALQR